MDIIPISQFEHRVAHWAARIRKQRRPLHITQRGKTSLVVVSKDLFDQWQRQQEELQALEIKLLIEAGDRAFREGKFVTHEEVGRRLGLIPRTRKRKS